MPDAPAFRLGGEIELPPPTIEQPAASLLVVVLLPEHPFVFPPFADILAQDGPEALSRLREEGGIRRLVVLVPRKLRAAFRNWVAQAEVVPCGAEYPLTEERLRVLTRVGRETFRCLSWFDFYKLILARVGKPLSGIPVSVSFPSENRYACGLAGAAVTPASILDALTDAPVWAGGEEGVCLDHPFRGALVAQDQPREGTEPYSLIYLPKNQRQPVPLTERVAAMLWERRLKTFHGFYHSLPVLLGTPCQKCLHCADVCPAHIVPFMISALYAREYIKDAVEFKPAACIECGLCSFVCPSGIPLLHNIRQLKKKAGVA